jgi:hypothetical protein
MTDAEAWASIVDSLFSAVSVIVPALATAGIAWYTLRRDERMAADRRRAEASRLGLEHALKRRFELIDRVAEGAGQYEGLLQYWSNLAVDLGPDRRLTGDQSARLEELTGGHKAWGAYRAAAHERGDAELESACIGLGNEVSLLLIRRPQGEIDVIQREQWAYEKLKVIWRKLRELRVQLESELPRP